MIEYSRQNPIDMNAPNWSFNDSLNRFYNWLNQPIQGGARIPPRKVKLQMFGESHPEGITGATTTIKVFNTNTGDEISGVAYGYFVRNVLYYQYIFEYIVDLSLIPINTPFYVEITIDFAVGMIETTRSSCYTISQGDNDKLVCIEFSNTVDNRPINGLYFDPDSTFLFYMYLNKFDTEIEIVEDDEEQDFKGNSTLVEKTHSEADIFEVVDMPKKTFMALIAISENDEIYVNGRRANITFDKATEARIGAFEIPFINALMRVTYADDDGLLIVRNVIEPAYLKIKSDSLLNIDSSNNLKIQ